MAYVNGRMPDDLLHEVEPGMFLEAGTAAAYLKAKAASGGILRIAKPAGAYRSYAVQVDMKANPGKYGLDPASSIPLAAPGQSTHGWGTRVDIADGAGRTWAIIRLDKFGFKREFGSADPGHFQYLNPTFASIGTTPLPGSRRSTMSTLFKHQDKNLWALAGDSPGTPANWLETTGQDFANQLAGQHGTAAVLSAGTWTSWKSAYLAPLVTNAPAATATDLTPVLEAIASVNANINDQPTEFTVRPK